MCPLRVEALLCLTLCACHGNVSWVPNRDGRMNARRQEQVRLPGLGYLALGQPRHEAVSALRSHGFECSEEGSSNRSQACVRPPGKEEPSGGVVMMEFEQNLLAGVQAQLQPEGDGSGRLALARFQQIEQEWTQKFGQPEEIRRPGIVATRRSLRDGTALLAVCYDGEPTVIVEHVQLQSERVNLAAPPRESSTR